MWKWEMSEVDGKKVWRRKLIAEIPKTDILRVGRQATSERRAIPVFPVAAEA